MKKEFRTLTGDIEIRKNEDGTDSRTISGYGAVFNSWSHTLGFFKEKVNRNAFDGVSFDDVVATFNHDFNMIMARTSAGSLRLSVDETGLRYEFDVPNTTAGNDLLENIRNKNVVGSSFMFSIKEDKWTFKKSKDDVDEREIMKVDKLYELGPVVMPAYPDTSASARSAYDDAVAQYELEARTLASEKQKQNLKLKIKITKTKHK